MYVKNCRLLLGAGGGSNYGSRSDDQLAQFVDRIVEEQEHVVDGRERLHIDTDGLRQRVRRVLSSACRREVSCSLGQCFHPYTGCG